MNILHKTVYFEIHKANHDEHTISKVGSERDAFSIKADWDKNHEMNAKIYRITKEEIEE